MTTLNSMNPAVRKVSRNKDGMGKADVNRMRMNHTGGVKGVTILGGRALPFKASIAARRASG